jgi:hypothetical protein
MAHSSISGAADAAVAGSWDPPNIPLQTRTFIIQMTRIGCVLPHFTPTSLDMSQFGSPPRLPTSNSNSPHMLPALLSYMHVSWRRLTPSIRNVTHMPKRSLMSVATASRFRHSYVLQGPSEPRWRRKETVYARVCYISSRKARRTRINKSPQLTACLQSRSVTIIVFGHTAVSRPPAWRVRLKPSV